MQEIQAKNIIVRMPNWIGDLVMATSVLSGVRELFPHAKITAMCLEQHVSLLEGHPAIDIVLGFKKTRSLREWILLRQELVKSHFDLGILLTNSLSSAWLFFASKIKECIGFAGNFRHWMLTKKLAKPNFKGGSEHLVQIYNTLLSLITPSYQTLDPSLHVSIEEQSAIHDLLLKYGLDLDKSRAVIINPGAAYGEAKCWLPERFEELTHRLILQPNLYVIIIGDKSSYALGEQIKKTSLSDRVLNLAGATSLKQLMALLKKSALVITNDSGPMHMSSALGTPVLALFGSTNSTITGPYKGGKVINKQVACAPCYLRKCPIDFKCMKFIETDEVYQTALNILLIQ